MPVENPGASDATDAVTNKREVLGITITHYYQCTHVFKETVIGRCVCKNDFSKTQLTVVAGSVHTVSQMSDPQKRFPILKSSVHMTQKRAINLEDVEKYVLRGTIFGLYDDGKYYMQRNLLFNSERK
jgi:hypothetical protein